MRTLYVKAHYGRAQVLSHVGDLHAAIQDFQNAIHLCRDTDLKNQIRLQLATVFVLGRSDYDRARNMIKSILNNVQSKKNNDIAIACYHVMGKIFTRTGKYQSALRHFTRVISAYRTQKKQSKLAEALNDTGNLIFKKGDYRTARSYYQKAADMFNKVGDRNRYAIVLNNIGAVHRNLADTDRALVNQRKSLATLEKIHNKIGISIVSNNIGNIYFSRADYHQAITFYRRSTDLAEQIGDRDGSSISLNNLGNVYIRQGELSKALKTLSKSYSLCEAINSKRGLMLTSGNIATIYRLMGRLSDSLHYNKVSYVTARSLGDAVGMAMAQKVHGMVWFYRSCHRKAFDTYHKAVSLAKKCEDQELLIDIYLDMIWMYIMVEDLSSAGRILEITGHLIKGGSYQHHVSRFYALNALAYVNSKPLHCTQSSLDHVKKGMRYINSVETRICVTRMVGMVLPQSEKHEAIGVLQKSIMLADRSHMAIQASLSRLELAKVFLKQGKKGAGKREIARAMTTLKALNIRWGVRPAF